MVGVAVVVGRVPVVDVVAAVVGVAVVVGRVVVVVSDTLSPPVHAPSANAMKPTNIRSFMFQTYR